MNSEFWPVEFQQANMVVGAGLKYFLACMLRTLIPLETAPSLPSLNARNSDLVSGICQEHKLAAAVR